MIRIRQTADYRLPLALDAELFPDDEAPETEGVWFLGKEDGQAVCYAAYTLEAGHTAYLTRAGVKKSHQGRGLQQRLIKIRCQHAKRQGATWAVSYAEKSNFASITSLIRAGFHFYYPNEPWAGKDFYYFRKKL